VSRAVQVFRSRRVITAEGERPAAVHVSAGKIVAVAEYDDTGDASEATNLADVPLLPGFVDSHVHVNEPGRTDWEGFATATRAAAAGGITTIVDMPLNCLPSTTTPAALRAKLAAARNQLHVDVAFWGGLVPGNSGDLRGLHEAGVAGFKCFLSPSGVDEFPHVSADEMTAAMGILAELGSPLLVHAEDAALVARYGTTGGDRRDAKAWAASRPPECEVEAVRAVIRAAEHTGARAHIVHLATADALPELRAARARGVQLSVETCPHYLWFAAEDAPPGATAWKCAPPIRDASNRDRLREALFAGDIDLVASDHSPAPPALKSAGEGDFFAAWGGIASLQLSPLIAWTIASRAGRTLSDLSRWLSAAPARLAGLNGRKGAIAAGCDADFVAFDDSGDTRVDAQRLEHRHKITPYDGAVLRGRVQRTWLRGELIYDRGVFPGNAKGRPLLRNVA
jgi:allantoinase